MRILIVEDESSIAQRIQRMAVETTKQKEKEVVAVAKN